MRACDNTVSKAVEYETQDLLDEAITNANRGLTTGANTYEYAAKMYYGLEMKDISMYLSAAQDLGKSYLKADSPKIEKLLKELLGNKIQSKKVSNLGLQLAEKYYKKEKTASSATRKDSQKT